MIEGFFGMPGMGKTYLMTRLAIKLQKKGKVIYANYALQGANRFEQLHEVFDVRDAVILLDEAGLVAPASMWQSIPFEVMSHWRQHRHHGVSLWYTAQDALDVAAPLRRVTQFANYVSKFGPIIKWRTMGGPKWKEKYGGGITLFDMEVAKKYDTHFDVVKQAYLDKSTKGSTSRRFDAKA